LGGGGKKGNIRERKEMTKMGKGYVKPRRKPGGRKGIVKGGKRRRNYAKLLKANKPENRRNNGGVGAAGLESRRERRLSEAKKYKRRRKLSERKSSSREEGRRGERKSGGRCRRVGKRAETYLIKRGGDGLLASGRILRRGTNGTGSQSWYKERRIASMGGCVADFSRAPQRDQGVWVSKSQILPGEGKREKKGDVKKPITTQKGPEPT